MVTNSSCITVATDLERICLLGRAAIPHLVGDPTTDHEKAFCCSCAAVVPDRLSLEKTCREAISRPH